jgi:alkylated DNA repair protein alkB family protein 8
MSEQIIPSGLRYVSEAISEDLAGELLAWLESSDTTGWFPVGGERSRRVMHFGYAYDYRSGSTTRPAGDMPDIILRLRDVISDTFDENFDENWQFDQCILNRYEPGQGIAAHIDSTQYGDVVACFTMGSGAEMEFTHRELGVYKLYTEPRSLYVMTGDSRYVWRHSMRGRLSDPGNGKRGIRYSITFRKVKTGD